MYRMRASKDRRGLIQFLALFIAFARLGVVFWFFAGDRGAYVADAFGTHFILYDGRIRSDRIVSLHGKDSFLSFLLYSFAQEDGIPRY